MNNVKSPRGVSGSQTSTDQTAKHVTEHAISLGSEHTVLIEKLVVGGAGLARLNNQVVFVPLSAPEDELKIKITQVEKNYLTAKIIQILKPSSYRRKAACQYFSDCGGCNWQHIDEASQINQKEIILKDLLKKFLPDLSYNLSPTISSEKKFEYRNRIQIKQIQNKVGYFKHESHDLVDIDDCLIAEPEIRNWLKNEKSKLKKSDRLKKFELKVNANNKFEITPLGEKSEGLSFSQVNSSVNSLLVHETVQQISKFDIKSITEFYAGSGNFTFSIVDAFKTKPHPIQIDAIELNPDLTRAAVEELKKRKLQSTVRFFTTKSEVFPLRNKISEELILLDPPRSGCEKPLIEKIGQIRPRVIVYISCHPVSLARDLKLLNFHSNSERPLYKISFLQIFDMFPQTDHFETLCVLELN